MDQVTHQLDLLDIDPLKITNKELRAFCKLAMWRAMRLLREIIGPNLPNEKGYQPSIIENNSVFIKKMIDPIVFPIELTRGIEIQENFLSDDYLFWGYWFKKWVPEAKKKAKEEPERYTEKDYWAYESGTKPYADYATRINHSGKKIPGKAMSIAAIDLLEELIFDTIDNLYGNFSERTLLKEDTESIFLFISDFSELLRIKALKNITNSLKKRIKRSILDLKKIERRYVAGIIPYYDFVIKEISENLLNHELSVGGWSRNFFPGITSALNTGEVGIALSTVISIKDIQKLERSLLKLLDLIKGDGYWEPSHKVREGRFANAFATGYLIKNYGTSKYQVVMAATRLENKIMEIGPLNNIHSFSCFCHTVRTLANAYKFGMGCGLGESLMNFKNTILEYQSTFWGEREKNKQTFRIAMLATSMALLSITKIAKVIEIPYVEERVQLSNMLMKHPEKPEVNAVRMKIESRGLNPFDHWVKPWKVAALAMQPHVDRLYLFDITRDLFKHYDHKEKAVSHKINRPSIWATSHFLYALSNVNLNLKDHYL